MAAIILTVGLAGTALLFVLTGGLDAELGRANTIEGPPLPSRTVLLVAMALLVFFIVAIIKPRLSSLLLLLLLLLLPALRNLDLFQASPAAAATEASGSRDASADPATSRTSDGDQPAP